MELNEKLARRIWPEFDDTGHSEINIEEDWLEVIDRNAKVVYTDIAFTANLNACFEWLKPFVIKKGIANILTWRSILRRWLSEMARDKAMDNNPALALCTVIEQWADKEQKDES